MNNDVKCSHKTNQMGKPKTELPSKGRRSIRIPEYDYSQAGAYFITMVTQNRDCLFGIIQNHEMVLSPAGKMIDQVCQEIPKFLQRVGLDHYQIMPNHFHGIIILNPIETGHDHQPTVGATLPWPPEGGSGCPGQTRRSAPCI